MIKIIALMRRKPGMSREDFIKYYEDRHVPFVRTLLGPHYVMSTRNFILPAEGATLQHLENATHAPAFDVVTEVWFDGGEQYARFVAACSDSDIAEKLAADEANLFDRDRAVVIRVDERVTDYRESG